MGKLSCPVFFQTKAGAILSNLFFVCRHIFFDLSCMNQSTRDQTEKLPQQEGDKVDSIEEALIKAKLILELHKGPDDLVVRENREPDSQATDAVAESADDSGE